MIVLLAVFLAVLASPLAAAEKLVRRQAPDLPDFDELVTLSGMPAPKGPLGAKLAQMLETPIIDNQAWFDGFRPHRPEVNGLGPVLRAAFWNIERGQEFEMIRLAFTDPGEFKLRALDGPPRSELALRWAEYQLGILQWVDVLILNEVDLGMTRTEYRDVARDLARALGMNYAFGTEFLEVDRLHLGLDELHVEDPDADLSLQRDLRVDQSRYRGLHGTAVLSRYPITNARIHRLPVCYDWFEKERAAIAALEKGRRWSANTLFLERIAREVRHGGRMALIVDLAVPDLPGGTVTVVGTHLENKSKPECRNGQMRHLLSAIRDVSHPVILAGDLNTSGSDATPTSVQREIMKRVSNYKFWAGQALRWVNPVSLPQYLAMPATYFRSYLDPTATHVPFFARNPESGLFRSVGRFRFADGGAFDFRGQTGRNLHDRQKKLANSNQRGAKGFRATFSLQRDFGGLVGRFKLDWLLIKPYIAHPTVPGQSYLFAPHFPLTMAELNELPQGGLSDHHPITVDLPLFEPVAEPFLRAAAEAQ